MTTEHYLLDDERMTPEQLLDAMRQHGFVSEDSIYGVDVRKLAAIFKVSVQAVYLWLRDINPIPHYVKLYFYMLADRENSGTDTSSRLGAENTVVL